MAKFYGNVWFMTTVESAPSYWEEKLVPMPYMGDILKNAVGWKAGVDKINDDLTINNTISIVADDFAMENLGAIKCVDWLGNKWKISDIEVDFPRLKLSIGGLYNE